MARNASDFGQSASLVPRLNPGNVFAPEHGEVGICHLGLGGQIHPNLEQLCGIGCIGVEQRKHFAVHDALACGKPLHVAIAEAGCGAERIRMVDQPAAHNGHGLEAPMRVGRKARNRVAVVHAPAVFTAKVLTDIAPGQ